MGVGWGGGWHQGWSRWPAGSQAGGCWGASCLCSGEVPWAWLTRLPDCRELGRDKGKSALQATPDPAAPPTTPDPNPTPRQPSFPAPSGSELRHSQFANRHVGPDEAIFANLCGVVDDCVALRWEGAAEVWHLGRLTSAGTQMQRWGEGSAACPEQLLKSVTYDLAPATIRQAARTPPIVTWMCGPSASCSGERCRSEFRCRPRPAGGTYEAGGHALTASGAPTSIVHCCAAAEASGQCGGRRVRAGQRGPRRTLVSCCAVRKGWLRRH